MLSFYASGSPGFVFLNPLSLVADDSRSVLAVKGSLRRFAPWTAAGRSGETRCSRGKRGISGRADAPKGTFRPYQPLEPQPRGAVTRRAVAQRRSRASGLTRPLAEAIRGFGLGFVGVTLVRSAAVCNKSCVFSYLPIRNGLVLPFREGRAPLLGGFSFFSVSYPQARRSYYLFCTTCSVLHECPVVSAEGVVTSPVVSAGLWCY